MAMHMWGDKDFDWAALTEAQRYIHNYVYRRSLCHVIMKEKYGELRIEWLFIPGDSIYAIQFWYHNHITRFIRKLWNRYGVYCLERALKKASKKWPHITDEITSDYYWTNNIIRGKYNGM